MCGVEDFGGGEGKVMYVYNHVTNKVSKRTDIMHCGPLALPVSL